MLLLDVFIVALVLLFLAWVVTNIARYLGRKTGGTGGWFAISDAWIKADEQKTAEPKGKERK